MFIFNLLIGYNWLSSMWSKKEFFIEMIDISMSETFGYSW